MVPIITPLLYIFFILLDPISIPAPKLLEAVVPIIIPLFTKSKLLRSPSNFNPYPLSLPANVILFV